MRNSHPRLTRDFAWLFFCMRYTFLKSIRDADRGGSKRKFIIKRTDPRYVVLRLNKRGNQFVLFFDFPADFALFQSLVAIQWRRNFYYSILHPRGIPQNQPVKIFHKKSPANRKIWLFYRQKTGADRFP